MDILELIERLRKQGNGESFNGKSNVILNGWSKEKASITIRFLLINVKGNYSFAWS